MITYRQVAEDIKRRIEAGEWTPDPDAPPGQRVRLPRWREFAEEYQVTARTIGYAMANLADRGIIHTERGRGSYLPPCDGDGSVQ